MGPLFCVSSKQPKFIGMASTTGGSHSTSVSSPAIEEDAHNPLWRYVTKQQKLGDGGGNMSWQCNFCHQTKKSSYTRVRAHLIHEPGHAVAFCPKVKSSDIAEMKRLEEECNEKLRNRAPKKVPLPTSNVDYDSKKRKASGSGSWSGTDSNTAIGKSFNLKLRDQMDAEIARMFYASGLPFHLARSPYYVSCIQFAANNALASYVPPGYNKLRTNLLRQERAHIDRLLQPIKGTWKEKGVSIVSDGWSDSQRRPLINFMAVTESGPMFLKAVDCTGEIKDKFFIYGLLKEVIEDVGPQNVIQVITDNAKNCAGAGHLIETQFENIVWTPCVVHTLNLALQNICMAKNIENNQLTYEECSWITDLAEDVVFVKNYIMNHSMRLAIFNEFVPLKLLSVASTRFASVLVMLKRFKLIKGSLQAMVISERWSLYRDDDKEKAKAVKDFVLDDIWWDKMTYVLSFTAPIYDMLRVCDTDRPCLHLVYDMWDTMIEKVKGAIYRHEGKRLDETSTFYDVVHKILVDRWNKNNTPLHCLAHSLNPR